MPGWAWGLVGAGAALGAVAVWLLRQFYKAFKDW